MAVLSEQDRETIRGMFEGLVDPVRLVFFTLPSSGLFIPGRPQCETCDDAQHVLEEVAELSDKLSFEAHHLEREADEARRYGVDRAPSLLVLGPDDGRVRYVGAPFGHEFALLLQDIQFISKGETKLSQETRDALSTIEDDIHLQVFVTPT